MPTGVKLTFEFKKRIVDFYLSYPMTYEKVQEEFNLSLPTIGKILKSFNIKPWPKFKIYSPNFNERYFEKINTENQAYFLGLMITDGNIFDNYKSKTHPPNINWTIQENDSYILEILKKDLNLNKKLSKDGRGCIQLCVFSHLMKTDLEQYGVIPKKTFETTFPKNLSYHLYPHLIRGILDGDGSVSFYSRPNRKTHVKAVRFCSANPVFLNDLLMCLSKNINTQKLNLYQEKESLWSCAFRSKNDLEKIIDYLYRDATIYLTRKKEKCDLILQEIRKYRDN